MSLTVFSQPEDESGTSTPLAAPAATEDLDFSDLKKKKSSKKKKAALDMEAFEKELHQAKAKDVEEDEGGEEVPVEIDEAELGEDPFAGNEAGVVSLDVGTEPWLNSDRDYTYQEVGTLV